MYLEKTYEIENTDYILVSCNSPDSNAIIIRARESETIQTNEVKFYLLDKSKNNAIVTLLSFSTIEIADLKTEISNIITNEIFKANSFLNVFGINLDVVLEILFPHDTTSVVEVPTISNYQTMFERETIDYLINSGSLTIGSIENKSFINASIIKLKNSNLWNILDFIIPLTHDSYWDSLKVNTNMKVGIPSAWKNISKGMNGDVDISGVTLDGSINGSYISLGHQPLAKDFKNYIPVPNFTRNSSSFTVKISNASGSGCIYRRSDNQDLLSFDSSTNTIKFNCTGNKNIASVSTFNFTGNINGIWTVNRINSTTVELWKDGVLLTSATNNSEDFNLNGCYSSLGYGSEFYNALSATYQFACIGKGLVPLEITTLNSFINNYVNGVLTNDNTVFV